MSPCVEGPRAHKTGRFEVLQLPGASTGIWLYDRSVTPKHHDSKRKRDMGTRAYAVYMQFLWTAEGAGTKGAIKILQINYTKKKGKLFIYEICTRPSLRRHHLYEFCRKGERKKVADQYLMSNPSKLKKNTQKPTPI